MQIELAINGVTSANSTNHLVRKKDEQFRSFRIPNN